MNFPSCIGRYRCCCVYLRYNKSHYKQLKGFRFVWVYVWNTEWKKRRNQHISEHGCMGRHWWEWMWWGLVIQLIQTKHNPDAYREVLAVMKLMLDVCECCNVKRSFFVFYFSAFFRLYWWSFWVFPFGCSFTIAMVCKMCLIVYYYMYM